MILSMPKTNLVLIAYLFFAVLMISCQTKQVEKGPPNIVFIMSDDHGYQAISAYSDHLMQTPNIDRIAKEGILFTNACVTNSICAPSRAVILTGKHSHINGKIDNRFPFDTSQVTFPQLLQDGGYQTAMFGKLHFGNNPKGFDQFKILPGQGKYYNPDFITKNEGNIQVNGYTTDIITDMTLDWLSKERIEDKPFLLMYLHKAPHRNWMPAERHRAEYTGKEYPVPETLFDDYEGRGTAARTAEMNILLEMDWAGDSKLYPETMDELGIPEAHNWDKNVMNGALDRFDEAQLKAWNETYQPINEQFVKDFPNMSQEDLMNWRYQRYMQDYLGSIAAVDEGVGKVLDYLDSNSLRENTIVVYTSDQGFYLGEHGWFDKRFIYNESFKTPLVVRWPNVIEADRINTQMVQNLDFAQTFLEAAGVEADEGMQGESLVPLFKGDHKEFRDAAYYHYYEFPGEHNVRRHYGAVTEDYKLIHFYYDIDEWELYDRKADPQELKNVYQDPEYSTIVSEMHKKLSALRLKYKDSKQLDQLYIDKYKELAK